MKLPGARSLAIAAVAAVALVSLAALLGSTKFGWMDLPFWAPGFFAAAIVFPQGIEGDHPNAYLVLVCILNFLFTWFAISLFVAWYNEFSKKKRRG